jgi:hypothetical protein
MRRRIIDVQQAGFRPGRFRRETLPSLRAAHLASQLTASLGERALAKQLAASEPASHPASRDR